MLNLAVIGVPWEYPTARVHTATHSTSKYTLAWAPQAPEFLWILTKLTFDFLVGCSVLSVDTTNRSRLPHPRVDEILILSYGLLSTSVGDDHVTSASSATVAVSHRISLSQI